MSPSAIARHTIGPNAIIRVAEALGENAGRARTEHLFAAAGLSHYLAEAPGQMVDEREVLRLHCAVRDQLRPADARAVFRDAGVRTADYLMANRIPRLVQQLLRVLPARAASRLLLAAIRRNAWTFAGSGDFVAEPGVPAWLRLRNNPLCRGVIAEHPACEYYAATFETLFRALVTGNARVTETGCEATGAATCRFRIDW